MTTYRCIECGHECDLIEVDHGGWEEFWGAKVWHHQYTDVTDCCQSEDYETIEEELDDG